MIQLYAKLEDLRPTEFKDDVASIADYKEWYDSIKEEGIKNMLHVDSSGFIRDGNARYYIAKLLGHEYLPISWQFFTGLHYDEKAGIPYLIDLDPIIRAAVSSIAHTEVKEVIRR